jgi:hypothetical protein
MLLILALLLWPLDIALRRVSIGRRELADGRRWVTGGWRRRGALAPRPVEVAGMLAARDRAAGTSARAAILRGDTASGAEGPSQASPVAAPPPKPVRAPAAPAATTTPPPGPAPAPARSAPVVEPPAAADAASDTLARLREAKRRSRGG